MNDAGFSSYFLFYLGMLRECKIIKEKIIKKCPQLDVNDVIILRNILRTIDPVILDILKKKLIKINR